MHSFDKGQRGGQERLLEASCLWPLFSQQGATIFPITSHHKWRTHALTMLTMLTCASACGSMWICNLPISMPHLGRLDCFWIGQSTVSRSLGMVHNYPWVLDEFGTGVNCRIRKGNEYPMTLTIRIDMVHLSRQLSSCVICLMTMLRMLWIHETSSNIWYICLKRIKNRTISCTWRCSYLSAFVTSKSLAPDDASNHRSFDNFTEGTWAFWIEWHVKIVKSCDILILVP